MKANTGRDATAIPKHTIRQHVRPDLKPGKFGQNVGPSRNSDFAVERKEPTGRRNVVHQMNCENVVRGTSGQIRQKM